MLRRDPKSGDILRDDKGNVTPVTDYPYADDGLQIWYALKDWFTAYLSLYYNDSDSKTSVKNLSLLIKLLQSPCMIGCMQRR